MIDLSTAMMLVIPFWVMIYIISEEIREHKLRKIENTMKLVKATKKMGLKETSKFLNKRISC